MNEFLLFAHGEDFDVDAYVATTTLRFDYEWRRGDQSRYSCVEYKHPTSGVEILLGDGRLIPLPEQETIAVEYLKAHRDELRALASYHGVGSFVLGLQYHWERPGDDVTGFCIAPSALLMWHALDIGLQPSYFVTLARGASESRTN